MKTVFGLLLKHFWIPDKFILIVWTHFLNVILILGQFNLSSNKGIVFRFTTVFSTVSLSYSGTSCDRKILFQLCSKINKLLFSIVISNVLLA